MLARNPGFTAAAVVSLALGIGANTAVFSVFKAVILQPFPYPESERLVHVWETDKDQRSRQPLSGPDYFDLREQNTSFEEFGVYTTQVFNVSDGEPERIQGIVGVASVLRALGARPALGRLFTDAEEKEGNHRVAVLGNDLWKRLYGADPEIIGRMIRLNGEDYEVVGIMPAAFEFHSPWFTGAGYELWAPLVLSKDNSERGNHSLLGLGKLRPGVDWRTAEAELRAVASRLARQYPSSNGRTQVWLQPFKSEIVGGALGQLVILLGTVGLVLLIACANVASMLLAKGTCRQSEMAVRASLGASRRRIISQLLAESLVLSLLGGMAGLFLAVWSLDVVRNVIPPSLPRGDRIQIDGWVLLFSLGISIVTAFVFGLVPARTAARTNVVSALKEGGGSRTGASARSRVLRRLAVGQVAVAVLLTNGAVLLFKSYRNVLDTPQVFDTDGVLTVDTWLWGPDYENDRERTRFWDELTERLKAHQGVESAAVTTKLPLEGGTNAEILIDGQTFDPQVGRLLAERSFVSADYFDAMGIPLLYGRTLDDRAHPLNEHEVVVNRALAERCWPGESAIGKHLRENNASRRWPGIVVGVAENVRQWGLEHPPLPEIYYPYSANPWVRARLVVRSGVDPPTLRQVIREELSDLDADLPIADMRDMKEVFSAATRHRRFLTLLLDLFTGIALILAIIGIHGNMSFHVSQRRQEIGVRIALGATQNSLLMMIYRQTARLVLIGVTVGIVMTVEAALLSSGLVYGFSPLHPLYLSGGTLLVATAALSASLAPALRASRIDPLEALRTE